MLLSKSGISQLVVIGLNTTLTAKVISWRSVTHMFPGFLIPVLTQPSFQSHRLLFSHASAELRDDNTPERNFASIGYWTQPQGHEPDTLTTEPPGRGKSRIRQRLFLRMVGEYRPREKHLNLSYSFINDKISAWSKLEAINPFPNKPVFLRICSTSLLKTLLEKEKWQVGSSFSFSHNVFCSFGEFFAIFTKFKIVVCKLFQFWRF